MGLDIGVVRVEYLRDPPEPAYGFMKALMLDPLCGVGDDDDDLWGGSWSSNALYEFNRISLRKRANNWANQQGLSQAEKAKLRRWIRNLPWQDEHIMLHLGN